MSLWRNWLARSAVNRKVGGLSPPGGDLFFLSYPPTPASEIKKKIDPGRIRTCNPLIRSQMPYPLGHRATVGSIGVNVAGHCIILSISRQKPLKVVCSLDWKATGLFAKKAPARFELAISCLLDRRFNQLSHGAGVLTYWGISIASLCSKLYLPPIVRVMPEKRAVSVVVITSALHAEGRQFEPGTAQFLSSHECSQFLVQFLWVSGWPSGLRRQTQGRALFPDREQLEISGPLLRAWVRIPHLTKFFVT